DARFRTLPDRAHTGIAGSSLGGLISLYAYFRDPSVFGFAAALSPALWFANAAILDLVEKAPRVAGRIYLDVGLQEGDGWHSPALGRHMELQILGHAGARVFVFPTTLGTLMEWTDRWMHRDSVLGEHIESGWIQLFCLHHVHEESWYAPDHVHPGHRAWRHLQYDRYLKDEVVPFSLSKNSTPFLITTGAS